MIDTKKMREQALDNYMMETVGGSGTHYDGCIYNHYKCAIVKLCDEVDRLWAEREELRSQLYIATDLGAKRWNALNEIYEQAEKRNTNWCKRKAAEGLGVKETK